MSKWRQINRLITRKMLRNGNSKAVVMTTQLDSRTMFLGVPHVVPTKTLTLKGVLPVAVHQQSSRVCVLELHQNAKSQGVEQFCLIWRNIIKGASMKSLKCKSWLTCRHVLFSFSIVQPSAAFMASLAMLVPTVDYPCNNVIRFYSIIAWM